MIGSTRRSLMLAALLTAISVSGCSGGSSAGTEAPSSAGTPSAAGTVTRSPEAYETPDATPTEAADESVAVSVTGRKVTPSPGRVQVAVGDEVRITVTSDVANLVHVHGADVETRIPAGKPTSLDVTMDQSGVFEVELHDPSLLLFQLVVR